LFCIFLSTQLADLRQAKIDETTLDEKLATLKSVEQSSLSGTDVSVKALPVENPAMFAISQVKDSAVLATSTVSAVKLKNETNNTISKDLSFASLETTVIASDADSVVKVMQGIINAAPVTTIDEVKIEKKLDAMSANIKLGLYWAALPAEVSAVDEPINDLTADEKGLLDKLSKLKQPIYTTLVPQETTDRPNPFN